MLFPILDGRAGVYIAGHHHSMQHLKPIGKLNLFIAGSGGATNYGVDARDPRAFFVRSTHGFAVLDITTNFFAVRFIDIKEGEVYTASLTK